jgi:hypothetical protein
VATILLQIAMALVQVGAAFLGGVLVAHHVITTTQESTFVASLITHAALALPVLGALALTLWNKYAGRRKFMTALAMPKGATEDDVTAKIAIGSVTPSILTPSNTIPGVPKL